MEIFVDLLAWIVALFVELFKWLAWAMDRTWKQLREIKRTQERAVEVLEQIRDQRISN